MAGASDNNGWPPDGGTPDDLPDLPEEWGVIVIPDDLSELSDEVDAVRAELNTAPPPTPWQKLRKLGALAVRTPVLIISMAILVTVASLFASAWPGPPRQPATQRTAATQSPTGTLPALEMIGPDGQLVSLTGQLPAVVLLTDGCSCNDLITGTVAGVSSGTAVLVVTAARTTPTTTLALPPARTPQADGKVVTHLRDQTDTLRKKLDLGAPDGTAAVLLVDKPGKIVQRMPRVASAEVILPYLPQLSR
ncbi:hypothetical protein OHA21_36665 [Actinoplanes sp. NBC_00393]|uniref:hypothetical protein n=1 Tax=Actinoplanes sp. NBC_00393 TaxID=2975953 RepID=UPI002E204582